MEKEFNLITCVQVWKHLHPFLLDLSTRHKILIDDPKRLLFICGANQSINNPSERRKAVAKFVELNKPKWKVVYAENVFNKLFEISKGSNSLDVEHALVNYSDNVLIILESESAFAELGAFAHKSIRKKVILINNLDYKDLPSFINTGPIRAIQELNPDALLYYQMSKNGIVELDGIGSVFSKLSIMLDKNIVNTYQSFELFDLSHNENKLTLFLVHDLIHICYLVTRQELIEMLKIIFGEKNFQSISTCLCVLEGIALIEKMKLSGSDVYAYRSKKNSRYLHIEPPIKLVGAIRTNILKHRLYI